MTNLPDGAEYWTYTVYVSKGDHPAHGDRLTFAAATVYYSPDDEVICMEPATLAANSTEELLQRLDWLTTCVRMAVEIIDDPNTPKPWDYETSGGYAANLSLKWKDN
jgi:hypothetical protein